MVTTSNGPDLMKAKRVNTFKRTLLLLSSRTKKFILLPLHSFYPPNKHSVNLVKGKQAKGKKTWPTMTLTFDKLIMFNVYAHLLTFDLKTLLKSLHTLYAEAFCGWSTSQIGQRGHMTHSLDEDNTYRSSMTLTLDLGNLLTQRHSLCIKYELNCTGEKIFCRQVKLNGHACRWNGQTDSEPLPPPPNFNIHKERERSIHCEK